MRRLSCLIAIVSSLLTFAVVAVASAEERTWADAGRKHRQVAELVDVQVRLRTPEGKVISVPADRLSEADRAYLGLTPGALDMRSADVRASALAEWPWLGSDDPKRGPMLSVELWLHGEAAKQASAYRQLKIHMATDEAGKNHDAWLAADSQTVQDGMTIINRKDDSPFGLSTSSVRIPVLVDRPGPIRKLDELRGSVVLRTGGRHETIIIENVATEHGQTLKRAELAFTVYHVVGDDPEPHFGDGVRTKCAEIVVVEIDGDTSEVVSMEVTDKHGARINYCMQRGLHPTWIEQGFERPLPAEAQLRVVLHKDAEERLVKFAVEDIAVPPNSDSPDEEATVQVLPPFFEGAIILALHAMDQLSTPPEVLPVTECLGPENCTCDRHGVDFYFDISTGQEIEVP